MKLAEFFQLDEDDLLVNWLSDKIVVDLAGEMNALKVLQVAEEKITYGKSSKAGRDAMIRRLRSAIKDFPAIQRAWLFGSFARQDLMDRDCRDLQGYGCDPKIHATR